MTEINDFFFYGTLMDEEVIRLILGRRSVHFESAQMKGVSCRKILGENYPALVAAKDSMVFGKVLFSLTAQEIQSLDEYEGSDYERILDSVTLDSGRKIPVQLYRFKNTHQISEEEWGFESWQTEHRAQLLSILSSHQLVAD